MSEAPFNVERLDHLVITVEDPEATQQFYSRVLGMRPVTFGDGRRALHFGSQKINLHERGRELEPRALNPAPGSADLCFVVDVPISEAVERLDALGVEVLLGPVERTGALGLIRSVYLRDPDGNLIELASYSR